MKLNWKTKLGYGIGELGEATGYNVFYFFFLIFLTDVAGLQPAIAGLVSTIAILWDAITDPIIGYLSDNYTGKNGRRRPFMLAGAIPYVICLYLMFCNFEMSTSAKCAYVIIMSMLYWTFYTVYTIPYFALGAEMTDDFNERTSLRAYSGIFIHVGTIVAASAPSMIVAKSMEMGMSEEKGWSNVGLLIGVFMLIAILICHRLTRGTETAYVPSGDKKERTNIFRDIFDIFKLKPSIPLALAIICGALVCTMCSSGVVYLMSTNLGYSAEKQSLYLFIMPILAIAWVFPINKISDAIGKKKAFMLSMGVGGIGIAAFYLIGFPSFAVLIIWTIFFQFGNSALWTLYYSMMYDLCELDEFIHDRRREGVVTAVMAFCQKLGGAVCTSLMGFILAAGGYDGMADVQTESALHTIEGLVTWIPGLIFVIGAVALTFYQLTGERFEALRTALEARKTGKEYTTDGFKELL